MRPVLRRAARLLQLVLTVLLALLLAYNLWLIFQQQVMGTAHPTVFGYSVAVVASGSMEPALSVDDMIFSRAQDRYEVGDIITFAKGSSLTTHRIVAVTDEGYRTQGVPTMPLTRTPWPLRKWWAAWWDICRASAACWRP